MGYVKLHYLNSYLSIVNSLLIDISYRYIHEQDIVYSTIQILKSTIQITVFNICNSLHYYDHRIRYHVHVSFCHYMHNNRLIHNNCHSNLSHILRVFESEEGI